MQNVREIDFVLVLAVLLLVLIGIAFIFSSNVDSEGHIKSFEFVKQIVWFATGAGLLVLFILIDYSVLNRFALRIFVIICALLLYTAIFGRVVNGARSWIGVWEIGIQPAEFAKIGAIILLARFYSTYGKSMSSLRKFALGFGITLIPMGLVLLQPDMGSAMVFFPIFLVISFAAGVPLRYILFLFGLFAMAIVLAILPAWEKMIAQTTVPIVELISAPGTIRLILAGSGVFFGYNLVCYLTLKKKVFFWFCYAALLVFGSFTLSLPVTKVLKDYQVQRLIVFLKPELYSQDTGYHIIQSVTAVGSGGLTGQGFLKGPQSHLKYLPKHSTDFIFSIIGEESGFFGCLLIFFLYGVVLYRGYKIINSIRDEFGTLIIYGVSTMIFFHFMINVGMAMGVMPITGIPLLFLSYGGSALWMAMISVGIMLNIHMRRYKA